MKIKKIDYSNDNYTKSSLDLFYQLSIVQINSSYLCLHTFDNCILSIGKSQEAVMVRHIRCCTLIILSKKLINFFNDIFINVHRLYKVFLDINKFIIECTSNYFQLLNESMLVLDENINNKCM